MNWILVEYDFAQKLITAIKGISADGILYHANDAVLMALRAVSPAAEIRAAHLGRHPFLPERDAGSFLSTSEGNEAGLKAFGDPQSRQQQIKKKWVSIDVETISLTQFSAG